MVITAIGVIASIVGIVFSRFLVPAPCMCMGAGSHALTHSVVWVLLGQGRLPNPGSRKPLLLLRRGTRSL